MQMLLIYVLMMSHFDATDTSAPQALTIRITADSLLKGYANVVLNWQLFTTGKLQKKGALPLLIPASRHPLLVHLPAHLPSGSEDAWLRLDYHSTRPGSPLIATEWRLLKPYSSDDFIPAAGELSFTDSGEVFTISSSKMWMQFDKETGLIQHFEADHRLLADTSALLPAFGLPGSTPPTAWDSTKPRLQLFSTSTGPQLVIVRAEYTLPEVSCLLHLSYSINAAGVMLVEQSIEPDSTRPPFTTRLPDTTSPPDTTRRSNGPPLPQFGMTWILPDTIDSITWYGLAKQDTTSIPSIHTSALPASFVRWCSITDHEGRGIRISADSNFLDLSIHPSTDNPTLLAGKLSTTVYISRPSPVNGFLYGTIKYSYKVTPIFPSTQRDRR